jgi:hypothetical protein
MSTLGDAADVTPVIKFLPNTLQHLADDISIYLHDSVLRQSIVEAVAAIDRQMLLRVWQELDYRIDICRVTKAGHIENL